MAFTVFDANILEDDRLKAGGLHRDFVGAGALSGASVERAAETVDRFDDLDVASIPKRDSGADGLVVGPSHLDRDSPGETGVATV